MLRAELLNMISENFSTVVGVAGCHGKTTVTCMLAHIFTEANIPFTAHIGGDDLAYGNFINRGNQVFLSEVCEFKKNITKFNAHYAVCLNTGKDHMDCYSDEKELENAYISYVKRAYKSIIGVNDDVLNFYNGDNAVGFSIYNDSDFSAKNLKNNNGFFIFDLYIRGEKRAKIKMPIVGEYNVKNALAAIACSYEMGISLAKIKKGIKSFKGVKRRYEFLGFLNGGRVIADYAHHPTEIKSSISATKENCKGKVFVCFQPHTYSRTLFLKEEFVEALSSEENLVIFKTYSAREEYILGGGAEDLCTLLPNSVYVEDIEKVIEFFKTKMTKKDCLLILGAGDLYDIIKYKIVK
jgi:UDP-N-acetylmuramate--alanine ligase